MKLTAIVFKAECQMRLTKEEVDLLMKLSAMHYDAHCRAVSQEGGFLFGLRNSVEFKSEPTLKFREIDTLCKILEIAHYSPKDKSNNFQEMAMRLTEELRDCLHRLNNVCGLTQEVR